MKIGLVQFTGLEKKEANVDLSIRLIRQAAERGAELACLHELANTIYFPFEERSAYFDLAETILGPTMERWQAVAAESEIAIVAPLFEVVDGVNFYNTAAMIDRDGRILGVYRKSCIPHIRRDGIQPTGFEKFYFRPGDVGFPVFETLSGLKVGILICFDRHFPENFRALALGGAELICVPTTAPRMAEKQWTLELQSAALANGCWIAGVNRVGRDEAGANRDWFGASVVVGPDAEIVAQANNSEEEVLIYDIDREVVQRTQVERGYFRDRRPDAYAILAR